MREQPSINRGNRLNRAALVCGISGELLKAGGEVVIEWLFKIYNMVWRTGVAPEDWQRAILVPIHKKSSRRKCGNYRGISLLSIPGKVFARILNDRVRLMTDNRLLEEQAGFRSGRGCIDQIFVIRQLVEKHLEKGKKMFAAFVDLEKAYDKVWRADLWRALREYGIGGRLLGAIEALYKESKACVRVEAELTEEFVVKQGLRQGCPLSPWLFNIFLDRVVREAMVEFKGGVVLDSCLIQILLFADDTVVMAQTEEDLTENIERLYVAMKRHSLAINYSKSNTMVFSKEYTECKVEVDGVRLKQARETVYLGVRLSENGGMESELERTIGMAATAVGALREPVFGNKELSKEAKLTVYNAVVVPTLVYGCEAWVLRERDKMRLQAMEMKVLRGVTGVTRLDCMRSEEIRKALKQEAVVTQVMRRREGWKDKVMENHGSLMGKVLRGQVEGKRPRGRPRKRWSDDF